MPDADDIDVASAVWVRAGASLMCAHTFVGGVLGLLAIRRLRLVHEAAKQRARSRAFHQTPTTEASLLNYELLWGILLADMLMCLASFPAFLAWAARAAPPPDELCYLQASTSVGLVGVSVLFSALVAVERMVHVVNQRSMPAWVHHLLVVGATVWGLGAGLGASLTSMARPPISASGFFCAPNWSNPDTFGYSMACLLTLVTGGAAICVGTIGVLLHLEAHYLAMIWKQVASIAGVFGLHWCGYIVMMIWQMFFDHANERARLRVMDAVVVALGFNNGVVNSCVFLLWTAERSEVTGAGGAGTGTGAGTGIKSRASAASAAGSAVPSSRRLSLIRVQPSTGSVPGADTGVGLGVGPYPVPNQPVETELDILAFAKLARDWAPSASASTANSRAGSQSVLPAAPSPSPGQGPTPVPDTRPSRPSHAWQARAEDKPMTGIGDTPLSPQRHALCLAPLSLPHSPEKRPMLVSATSPATATASATSSETAPATSNTHAAVHTSRTPHSTSSLLGSPTSQTTTTAITTTAALTPTHSVTPTSAQIPSSSSRDIMQTRSSAASSSARDQGIGPHHFPPNKSTVAAERN